MNIAVVVLNWNGKNLLRAFLPDLVKYSASAKIYIADNASTDGSISYVKEHFPSIKCVVLNKNYGFAGGYNKALQQIKAEIYVLINSDIQVTENWLVPFKAHFSKYPKTAIVQPKIKDFKNKNYFEYAGAGGGFLDYLGYPYCRGRLFGTVERDEKQYDKAIPINWASGACFGIRSQRYHEAKGFDEDYFAHQEEIDLCWRVKSNGHDIFYIPKSQIYHVGGATLREANDFKTFLNFRNSLYSLVKNLPKKVVLQVVFTRLFLDGLASLLFIFELRPIHAWAIFKAHISFYYHLPQTIRKRNQQKQTFNYRHKSIVFAYFIRRISFFSKL